MTLNLFVFHEITKFKSIEKTLKFDMPIQNIIFSFKITEVLIYGIYIITKLTCA